MAQTLKEGAEGYLEGINERTSKVELLKKARELAAKLHAKDDERASGLQEVEQRIRDKRGFQTHDLRTVLVTGTPREYEEMLDFLDDFEDLLPVMMARFQLGAKAVLEENGSQTPV